MSAVAANNKTGFDASAMVVAGLLALGALWSLIAAANGADAAIRTHAWVIGAGFMVGLFMMARIYGDGGLDNDKTRYNENIVKAGVIASMFWGVAGLLVGVVIAFQLAFPALLSFDAFPQFNFGRLRPVHTSAVIFAFGGNVLIATSFYVVQRTCRTRLAGGVWPWFVFWGYQLFIVVAATGYLLGITQSKEYAEPEWYADLWLTLVWVAYLVIFLATLMRRKEPHLYVANWFYLAFIVTIAMLHVVNNLAMPVSLIGARSYSASAAVPAALPRW